MSIFSPALDRRPFPPLLLSLQKQEQAIKVMAGQHQTKETEGVPPMCMTREERIDARNQLMAARFYYWTEVRRRRFDDVMHILSESEFFMSERTITDVLRDAGQLLSDLHTRRETPAALRRAYPSWSWEG